MLRARRLASADPVAEGPGPARHFATGAGSTGDASLLPMSVLSVALVLLGLVGWAAGSKPAEYAGFFLFVLFGFGSAWILALGANWPAYALSAPVGLAFTLLIGFLLVELKLWGQATTVFVVAVALASGVHLLGIGRGLLRTRSGTSGRHSGGEIEVSAPSSTTQVHAGNGTASAPPAALARRSLALVLVAAAAGVVLCLASAADLGDFVPKSQAAILGALSPAWYIGLALVIGAVIAGFCLCRDEGSSLLEKTALAAPTVALVVAVTLTPALAYTEPRYAWTFKHLGVTSYILLHGSVNAKIDIYQAWPGLFAGAAWVCRSVGLLDPTALARWWPPVIDLATVLVVQRLAFRVLGSNRRSWIAAALLIVGNTVGQDYFSPQAAAYLMAIAIFAIAFRNPGGRRGLSLREWPMVLLLVGGISFTHQLTPYMVFGATMVLLVFRLLRSWLIPALMIVVAGTWALFHLKIVRHYLNFGQIGNVGQNVLSKGLANREIHKAQIIHFNSYALAADVLIIGVIALVTLAQRRTRTHLAVAFCAASGGALFVASNYGNEGIFRVVLFAIPWLAILVADWNFGMRRALRWIPLISLPVLLGLYIFADMGLDYINAVRTGDVAAATSFGQTARKGSYLLIFGKNYAPVRSTGRYDLFHFFDYPYVARLPGKTGQVDAATSFDSFMHTYIQDSISELRKHRLYVLFAQEPAANLSEVHFGTLAQYGLLDRQFGQSAYWTMKDQTSTATLYMLRSYFYEQKPAGIEGTATKGLVLKALVGTWLSVNPIRYSFQWDRCNATGGACRPISGATHQTFTVRRDDRGATVRVAVTVTDTAGRRESVTTHSTAVVPRPAPRVHKPAKHVRHAKPHHHRAK